MTDDPDRPGNPDSGDLASPFLFVPHGAPEPVEWMRKHPGWVKFPATFVPRAPAAVRTIPGTNRPWPLDKRGQPWPRSRFGQPLRPLDEYPPGVRAPGERYTGPIADPDEAMRAASASEDMMAQAAKLAADPDAPIRAYLSVMEAWKNPGKYAGYPRPGTARAPSQTERDADAIQAGVDRTRSAKGGEAWGTGGPSVLLASRARETSMTDATVLPFLDDRRLDGSRIYPAIEDQSPKFKVLSARYNQNRPNYHQYEFHSYLGQVGPGVTPQAAYQELLKHAVPGGEHTGTPIEDEKPSTAVFAGRGGTVVTLTEPETLSIFNVTQPDHILHDGFVQRQIVVHGKSMYIRTIGLGNNSSENLAWGNEVAARPAFAESTAAIIKALYPPVPMGD